MIKTLQNVKEYANGVRQHHAPRNMQPSILVQETTPMSNNLQKLLYKTRISHGQAVRYDQTYFHRDYSVITAKPVHVVHPSAENLAKVEAIKQNEKNEKAKLNQARADLAKKERFASALRNVQLDNVSLSITTKE